MDLMVVSLLLASILAKSSQAEYLTETWKVAMQREARDSDLKGKFEMRKTDSGATMPIYWTMGAVHPEPRPAVIVAHHAVGIYHHTFLRKFCDDLADQGFVVYLPDFFHRVWSEEVPHGNGMPFEKMNVPALLGSLRDDQILEDIRAVLDEIVETPDADQSRVAVLGFCMGGRISWLAAVEASFKGRIHAAVPYHGGNVFQGRGEGAQAPSERIATGLHCPVLGHFGELDANPSPADMAKLKELAGSKLETKVYPGADHGFSCQDSAKYVESAAKQAWGETVQFLSRNLAGAKNEL